MRIERTIIVYMAADNDLSIDAYVDLEEIKQGFSEMGSNLIVFLDPADDVPQLLKIAAKGEQQVKSYPEFNSVDWLKKGRRTSLHMIDISTTN
jgi:hypothetical protein